MYYLITDQDNKTWRNDWGPNVTNEDANSNYHFYVYTSPLIASYLYPCYEGTKNPKLWTANGENQIPSPELRLKFSKLTTLEEFPLTFPTDEQKITYGILCAMNIVTDPTFREWAKKYLLGEDQTKETAHKVNEHLTKLMEDSPDASANNFTCAHSVMASILLPDPGLFASCAAHRVYHDSLLMKEPLNLDQTAQIVNLISPKDIAGLL